MLRRNRGPGSSLGSCNRADFPTYEGLASSSLDRCITRPSVANVARFSLPRCWAAVVLLLVAPAIATAGYLDENPDQVFDGRL